MIYQRAYQHKILTHCMLFNYQAITRKRSLNWDFNPTRHDPTLTFKTRNKIKNKNFILFYFFFSRNCVSIATKNSCHRDSRCDSHVAPGARLQAPRLSIVPVCPVAGVASWLGHDPVSQVMTRQSRTQKISFYVQFWTAQAVPNISASDPKILGLSI